MAAAARNADAFGALYDRHARVVYNLILRSVRNRETAEDIAQEVWTKVYHDLPRLRDPMAFPAWLYQMTSRICVDAARKRTRIPQMAEISRDVPATDDGPEASVLGGHDAQLAREALASLPAHQHLALFLREVDDRSYREISQAIGISETAVGLCLLRARRSFAKTYERLDRASRQERCEQMQSSLARVFDGEATPVQRTAVDGHLTACAHCREDLRLMREGSRRYAALALAPVPAALNAKILGALGLGVAGGLGGAAGLAGSLAAKLKMALFTLLTAGGVAAGVAVVPGTAPAVVRGISHLYDAPVGDRVAIDTTASGSVPSSASTVVAAESNKNLAPRQIVVMKPVAATTVVSGQVTDPTSELSVVPDVPVLPVVPLVAPNIASVIPTVAALPSTLLPEAPLPALPLALPTITVGGLPLP